MALLLLALVPSNILRRVSLPFTKSHPKIYNNQLSCSSSSSFQACLSSSSSHHHNQETFRPLGNFTPTIWKDAFDSTPSFNSLELETCDGQIEELKEQVKEMLTASRDGDPAVEEVIFINSLCRLGVSYHFESEIEERLNHIFEAQPNLVAEKDYDLHTVALLFRVFRQHGFKMSSGVFNKFKDCDGEFKESLGSDVRGMISLFEATHLRFHGEDILEEALTFTTAHLKSLAASSSSPNQWRKFIIDSLEQPLHKGVQRIEAYKFISFYEHVAESKNETLLKFAKLDFNRVQLLHRQELSYLTKWMKGQNFGTTYSYSRDRTVEIYLWSVAHYFEPRYSQGRLVLAKICLLVLIIDDTYDAYGTLEELQCFTDAIERWDISSVNELPDYMKPLYISLLNLFEELNNELAEEGRSYAVSFTKDAMKELVRAYFVEKQWFHDGYVPPFDERMSNALVSGTCFLEPAATYMGLGEIAKVDAYEWLRTQPKIMVAAFTLCRLMGDMVSSEAEQERGHVASVVESYMKEYGTSREETAEKFKTMIENAWKDMNEECMRPTMLPIPLLIFFVNFARSMEIFYKKGDGVINQVYLKDYVTKLFIEPIPV